MCKAEEVLHCLSSVNISSRITKNSEYAGQDWTQGSVGQMLLFKVLPWLQLVQMAREKSVDTN